MANTALQTLRLGVLLCIVSAGACGREESKVPLYPVRGKVIYEGQPAVGAWVVLHPINDTNPRSQKARGEVTVDGTFTLTTFSKGDGAPAGEYAVTVTWPLPVPPNAPPGDPSPGDRLKNRYNRASHPAWKVTIREEDNELPTFELK